MKTPVGQPIQAGDTVWVIDQYAMMGQDVGSDPFPGQATVVAVTDGKLTAVLKRGGSTRQYDRWFPDQGSCRSYIDKRLG